MGWTTLPPQSINPRFRAKPRRERRAGGVAAHSCTACGRPVDCHMIYPLCDDCLGVRARPERNHCD